jgi:hypothetical protein
MKKTQSKMDSLIAELIALIRQEEDVLKRFLDLLQMQKQFLIANQIDLFQSTVSEQESLTQNIRELEAERIAKVKQMADSTGLDENEITLTNLIEITLGDVSTELKELKKSLAHLVERIRRMSRVNELLIKRSMNFIQASIGWMIDASDITQIYDTTGRTKRQTNTSIMVNKTF